MDGWDGCGNGVPVQVAEGEEVKQHNDSVLGRVRILKDLKILELKCNRLVTSIAGDEDNHA